MNPFVRHNFLKPRRIGDALCHTDRVARRRVGQPFLTVVVHDFEARSVCQDACRADATAVVFCAKRDDTEKEKGKDKNKDKDKDMDKDKA